MRFGDFTIKLVNGGHFRLHRGAHARVAPKTKNLCGTDPDQSIVQNLAALGVPADSIDHVIMTHLHFDHSGGTTRRTSAGYAPVFSRARHVIQAREWQDATHPHERNRASYLAENLAPLEEAHLLDRVEGE